MRNLCALFLLLISFRVEAQPIGFDIPIPAEKTIAAIKAVELSIRDNVADSCWTTVDRIRQRARSLLEQAGIAVYTEPLSYYYYWSPLILIDALGGRYSGICSGYIRISVQFFFSNVEKIKDNSYEISGSTVARVKTILVGNAKNLNDSIYDFADSFINELIADRIELRRDAAVEMFLADRQGSDENIETLKELQEKEAARAVEVKKLIEERQKQGKD